MKPKRTPPGPGQESVWDYPRPPRVEPTTKHVRVVFNGVTIADTHQAHDEEDEDDDDRPRKKKKKKSMLLVLLLGGGALLFFGMLGVGALLYFFVFNSGGASTEMLAWAPDDTVQMSFINVAEALDKQALRTDHPEITKMANRGVASGDILTILEARSRNSVGGPGVGFQALTNETTVVKLKPGFDKQKVLGTGTELKAEGKSYHRLRDGTFAHFPSDSLLVHTTREDTMKNLLRKEKGKVMLSDTMKEAQKSASGDVWMVEQGDQSFFGLMAGGSKPKWVAISGTIAGDYMKLSIRLEFNDGDSANRAKEAMDKNLQEQKNRLASMPPTPEVEEQKKDIANSNVSQSGNSVTLSGSQKVKGTNKRGGLFGF